MKFSVITVCYNSADHIERAIQSVLAQQGVEVEYIVIDGGSSDGTLDILHRYADHIAFLSSEPDKGLYDAMNKGLAHATGDVVNFLNSDDWFTEGSLAAVQQAFAEQNCDIVGGNALLMQDDMVIGVKRGLPPQDDYYCVMPFSHQAIFARLHLFHQYGGFDLKYRYCADYDWVLRMYTQGISFYYLNTPVVHFSYGGLSASKECQQETTLLGLHYLPSRLESIYRPRILAIAKDNESLYEYYDALYALQKDPVRLEALRSQLLSSGALATPCALFGGGVRAYRCLELFRILHIEVCCLYDNAPGKIGKKTFGYPVLSPATLDKDAPFIVITTSIYYDEIAAQLRQSGATRFTTFAELRRLVLDFASGRV